MEFENGRRKQRVVHRPAFHFIGGTRLERRTSAFVWTVDTLTAATTMRRTRPKPATQGDDHKRYVMPGLSRQTD